MDSDGAKSSREDQAGIQDKDAFCFEIEPRCIFQKKEQTMNRKQLASLWRIVFVAGIFSWFVMCPPIATLLGLHRLPTTTSWNALGTIVSVIVATLAVRKEAARKHKEQSK